jgi:hypothetical protein
MIYSFGGCLRFISSARVRRFNAIANNRTNPGWWEKENQPLKTSVAIFNPEIFKQALRRYHDRVVAARETL